MSDTDKMQTALDLIYLVSCAVNEELPDKKRISETDLSDVLKMAQKHALSAVAAIALEKVIKLPDDFKEEKYKAIRRLSLLGFERERILRSLEEQKIWYLPVKGIVLKECYPKTAMREMADNDILCDPNRMSDVRSIMEGFGFECKSFGKIHHDVYEKPPQLDFEMHRSLFNPVNNPGLSSYFKNIKQKLIRDDDESFAYHMTNEDMYIYLTCHLYNHYRKKGTGLRSLLDIYVFRGRFSDSFDRQYIEAEFKKLDLDRFELAMRELAQKAFTNQPLSEEELGELSFFVDSNSHGTSENLLMRRLGNDDSSRSKAKYALSRIFPPADYVKRKHPFVHRHKAVYPFWVIFRPIKAAVKYPKRMSGELKRLKNFKKKENTGQLNK